MYNPTTRSGKVELTISNLQAKCEYGSRLLSVGWIVFCLLISNFLWATSNPYASQLRSEYNEDTGILTVSFILNDNAKSAEVVFSNGEHYELTDAVNLSRGPHAVDIDLSQLKLPKNTDISWSLSVEGESHSTIEVSKQEGTSYSSPALSVLKFFGPTGIAIDNNPQSKNFGRILVAESKKKSSYTTTEAITYYSATHNSIQEGLGLYAFTSDLQSIYSTDQIKRVFVPEGIFTDNYVSENSSYSDAQQPYRIKISEDDRIFVSAISDQTSIFEVDPENLKSWTPIFKYKISPKYVAGVCTAFDLKGEGDDLKLLFSTVSMSSNKCTSSKVYEYNLGSSTTEWTDSPSKEYESLKNNIYESPSALTNTNVIYDNEGGVWSVLGDFSNTPKLCKVIHINADGMVDYEDSSINPIDGGICFNKDYSQLVVSNDNKLSIYKISRVSATELSLEKVDEIVFASINNGASQLCFDYANNLHVVDYRGQFFRVYAFPNVGSEIVVTPAPESAKFMISAELSEVQINIINDGTIHRSVDKLSSDTIHLSQPFVCVNPFSSTLLGWTSELPNSELGNWAQLPQLVSLDNGSFVVSDSNINLYSVWQVVDDYGNTHYLNYPLCGDMLDIVDWNRNSITLNMNEYYNDTHSYASEMVGTELKYKFMGGSLKLANANSDHTFALVSDNQFEADSFIKLLVMENTDTLSYQLLKVPYIFDSDSVLSDKLPNDVDVIVRDGAVLKLSSNQNLNNCVIYPSASLVIDDDVTININGDLILRSSVTDVAKLYNYGNISFNADARFVYTKILTDNQNYHLLGLPFDVNLSDIALSNGREQTHNKSFRIKSYDGENRANTGLAKDNWVLLNSLEDKLNAKQGYEILSSSDKYREYCFPMEYAQNELSEQIIEVHKYPTTFAAHHEGWNLCVSPYTGTFKGNTQSVNDENDLSDIYITYLRVDGSYCQSLASITDLEPFTPFFYQNHDANELIFDQQTAFKRDVKTDKEKDNWVVLDIMQQENSSNNDKTAIRLNSIYSENYEVGYDLEKMLSQSSRVQLFSNIGSINLAFAALSFQYVNNQSIPLTIYSPDNNNYTISLNRELNFSNIESVYLYDTSLSQSCNLLENNYTFQASEGICTDRFLLIIKPESEKIFTSVSGATNDVSIQIYDILGHFIAKELTASLNAGIYIIIDNGLPKKIVVY